MVSTTFFKLSLYPSLGPLSIKGYQTLSVVHSKKDVLIYLVQTGATGELQAELPLKVGRR